MGEANARFRSGEARSDPREYFFKKDRPRPFALHAGRPGRYPLPPMNTPGVSIHPFGTVPGLGKARLFVLTHKSGATASFSDYGAAWVGWKTPDREGRFADIVLGFERAEDYAAHTGYLGAVCGRHANRIAKGRFSIDGADYTLFVNNGPNHLHGGKTGFDRHLWTATVGGAPEEPSVTFSRLSPDGEEGFPGDLTVSVTYTLMPDDAVRIDYRASTDAPTVLNLTNHVYFNLGGHGSGDCLDHALKLNASQYLPTDDTNIPTGEIRDVAGTPFDFRESRRLGDRIDGPEDQLKFGRGYDHCLVVDGAPDTLRRFAEVKHAASGRILLADTSEPGVQLYTGNWLAECVKDLRGKAGARYTTRSGFCLETQRFPDAPNRPAFRGVLLRPGEHYRSTTVYRLRQGGV